MANNKQTKMGLENTKGKKFELLRPMVFIASCPICGYTMAKIKGQKTGAWKCRKCGSEWWDKTEGTELIGEGIPDTNVMCLRCKTMPMNRYEGDIWECPQCKSQSFKDGAPDFFKIKDQMIQSTSKHLRTPDGGFRTYMKAKSKSRSGTRSKSRKKSLALEKPYQFE